MHIELDSNLVEMVANNVTQMIINLGEESHNQLIRVCSGIDHGVHVNKFSAIGFQVVLVFSQSEHFHLVKNSCLESNLRRKEMVHKDGPPNIGSIVPELRIHNQILNGLLQRGGNGTKK